MYYSVASAKYVDGYRLQVVFEDGTNAVVDLEPYTRRGGVFRRLANLEFFKHFRVNADFGVICWGARSEVDIAPETLYRLAGGRGAIGRVAETPAAYAARQNEPQAGAKRTARKPRPTGG